MSKLGQQLDEYTWFFGFGIITILMATVWGTGLLIICAQCWADRRLRGTDEFN